MALLPAPLRAALGVIATVIEDRRTLPDKALELPVLAVSTALQISLRAQQRYAAFTAKGDEVLAQLRGIPDEPPAWAHFDELPEDDATQAPLPPSRVRPPRNAAPSAFDAVGDDLADDFHDDLTDDLTDAEGIPPIDQPRVTEADRRDAADLTDDEF